MEVEMTIEDPHPSDQELLLAADGEVSSRLAQSIRGHLAGCWACRARMSELETTIRDFIELHRSGLDPHLPSASGPRALLKAQLAELAAGERREPPLPLFPLSFARTAAVCLGTVVLATAAIVFLTHSSRYDRTSGAIPEANLTPGATRTATRADVCRSDAEQGARVIPASVRQKVFETYGLPHARPDAYEVDYLITPELGGSGDIRNLWPEPYASTVWNAHVKDALEDRLHEMVCDGTLDLQTAQHDIASNWITAYKKYFHADKPIAR
jgi:hypothetical protein